MHEEFREQQRVEGSRLVRIVEALERLPITAWAETSPSDFSTLLAGRVVVLGLYGDVRVGTKTWNCLFHWNPDGTPVRGEAKGPTMSSRISALRERIRRGLYEAHREIEERDTDEFMEALAAEIQKNL